METILVLTDFSDAAFNAALYAAALTHQLGVSKLMLYHSYELDPPIETAVPLFEPIDVAALHGDSLEKLAELKDRIRTFIRDGASIDLLTDERPLMMAAEAISIEQRAGLVVMGITGKGRLEQVLIGSNSINIAKESSFPVLLIPSAARYEKIRRVVFACDLKNVSATTPVKEIKSLIHAFSAHLLVLNVDTEDQAHFTPDTLTEQAVLHQLWDEEEPEYYYTSHDDIAEGIRQFTSEHDIQMVIAVPKKHGFFESIFARSMTDKLTFAITMPLLLIKERPA